MYEFLKNVWRGDKSIIRLHTKEDLLMGCDKKKLTQHIDF